MITRWADLPWHVRFRAWCRTWIIVATASNASDLQRKAETYGRKLADRYRI